MSLVTLPLQPVHGQLQEDVSIIVEVEGDPYEWKEYIEDYHPFVEVVQVYDTLLNAIALKGKMKDLNDIEKEDFIRTSHPVRAYEVPTMTSEKANQIKAPERKTDSKYTGKGVKVAVIDTGIDHEHPDLETNYKGGYDVVDFDEDPMETLPEQGMPTQHGTHVSGIIAANGEMKGIAPDADIYVYRALGPGGFGSSVGIVAALEKAVEDGMDIVNLSLGSTINSPDWPTSIAVNKAIEMGVAVVIANGNEGPNNWTVSSPATSVKALSVGASIEKIKVPYLTVPLEDKKIPLTPMSGSMDWNLTRDYKMLDAGLGKEEIANARNRIVVMERGEISFTEKAMRAEQAGAEAVIIYNNEAGPLQGGLEVPLSIPVASISKEDGEWLVEQIEKERFVSTEYKEVKEKLASFSSKGPVVANWDIKPEILAPGVQIASTIPGGTYQEFQGTSMAAPYVAGVLALIKEAHPDWGPEKMKAAVLSTGKPILNEEGNKYLPIEQGMGEIQVEQAINPDVLIYGSRLTFGKFTEDTEEKKMDIVIENRTNKEKKFTFDYPKHIQGYQWEIPQTFYIGPKEKKAITVKLKVDSGKLAKGVHQGWLTLYNDNNPTFLPYLFVNQTADYPKIAGFELAIEPFDQETYQYNMYLPDGADNMSIELYDPDTLQYVKTIEEQEDIQPGMFSGKIKQRKMEEGQYLVFVKIVNGENYDAFVTDFQT